MPINNATQKWLKQLHDEFEKNPSTPLDKITMAEYRDSGKELFAKFSTPIAATVKVKKLEIPNRDGELFNLTVFEPKDSKPKMHTLIFYPGGGFVANLGVHVGPCSHIAEKANCRVIMVDTRLAPEHPYPAGVNDAFDAYRYAIDHAERLKVDIHNISVGGDSSGGNFAALVAMMVRDNHLPLRHQFLISPAVDISRSINTHQEYEQQDRVLQPELADWAYSKYLSGTGIEFTDPRVSPYFQSDLGNLAPVTIIVAEYDGLRADSEGYYRKLKAQGNDVQLIVCAGQVHSFLIARKALTDGEDPADIIAAEIIKINAENI